jgi:hypothetical protein
VREKAYEYVKKPVQPAELVELVRGALAAKAAQPGIEVVSARPNWVELLVPCDREVAARIQGFLAQLDTGLPEDVRDSVGYAFRELLLNAIEWGGKLDPSRSVRIAYLARAAHAASTGSPIRVPASSSRDSPTRPSGIPRTSRSPTWRSGRSSGCAPAASGS